VTVGTLLLPEEKKKIHIINTFVFKANKSYAKFKNQNKNVKLPGIFKIRILSIAAAA
jgi:hypothetical protein